MGYGCLDFVDSVVRCLFTHIFADVEVHHLEKATPLQFTNVSVVAGGPLRASLRAVIKYGKSTIIRYAHLLITLMRTGLTRVQE